MHGRSSVDGLAAALDLGSNSFHLIIARVDRGELVALERLKEKVQLGARFDRRRDERRRGATRPRLRRALRAAVAVDSARSRLDRRHGGIARSQQS